LYLTNDANSPLVLADFGIAKMLQDPTEMLTSMAGSFGYAAPEVMLKQGHGKAVDMWSMGVITYTLLCGYSPFRSENLPDLIEECRSGRIVFHERYWKDVSKDAKEFILTMLNPDPHKRVTSPQALQHSWLKGETATDHNLLPEIKAYMARARLRRGIEIIKLANRIESLKMQEDEEEQVPNSADVPADPSQAAAQSVHAAHSREGSSGGTLAVPNANGSERGTSPPRPRRLSRGEAIFREVVLAKVREKKEQDDLEKVKQETISRHDSSQ